MVVVTHHQTVQYALALQPPMPRLTLVILRLTDALQHLLGLEEAARQRVLFLLGLGDLSAGIQPADIVDLPGRSRVLRQRLKGLRYAREAFSRLVLLISKHLLNSASRLLISVP